MARNVIGPTGSRRRRWLFLCTTVAAIATAVLFIPSAFAVHDMGIFQLDGDAQTTLQSPVPAAEDWDLVCKANRVQIGTLSSAMTLGATTLSITETKTPKIEPFNIQIGSEQMTVTLRSGSSNPLTYTVTRHINGTTAATHASGAAVFSGCLFNPSYSVPAGPTKANPSTFVVDPSNSSNDDIL